MKLFHTGVLPVSLFIFLFYISSFSNPSFAISASKLKLSDCESYLLSEDGHILKELIKSRMRHFEAMKFTVDKYKVNAEMRELDVFDLSHFYDESLERLRVDYRDFHNELAENRVAESSSYQATPRPLTEVVGDIDLTDLDLLALGLVPGQQLKVMNLGPAYFSIDATHQEIDLQSKAPDPVMRLRLPTGLMTVGFPNRLASWRAGHAGYRRDAEMGFLFQHGQVLFLREVNGSHFGYVFDLATLLDDESKEVVIKVFHVRACDRLSTLPKDLIFPKFGQPTRSQNLCLTELGLELFASLESTPLDTH